MYRHPEIEPFDPAAYVLTQIGPEVNNIKSQTYHIRIKWNEIEEELLSVFLILLLFIYFFFCFLWTRPPLFVSADLVLRKVGRRYPGYALFATFQLPKKIRENRENQFLRFSWIFIISSKSINFTESFFGTLPKSPPKADWPPKFCSTVLRFKRKEILWDSRFNLNSIIFSARYSAQ